MHENVALLIKSGADLKATDNEGNNALLMAAKNAGADAKMIGLLVDAGCELSAKDKNGMDALASARKRSDLGPKTSSLPLSKPTRRLVFPPTHRDSSRERFFSPASFLKIEWACLWWAHFLFLRMLFHDHHESA